MGRIALMGGAYSARSIIADAQRCVNLVPEGNPSDSPAPKTNYPRAGLIQLIAGLGGASRCAYRASNGSLYEVIGATVYKTVPSFDRHPLGLIADGTTIVNMADNGDVVVLVDGTSQGYTISLSNGFFAPIIDDAFYGGTSVWYTSTVFVFNRPGTNQYYLSPPNWDGTTPFDPLDFASKVGASDNIANICVMKGDIWEVGDLTTEVSYNAGGSDFLFAPVQGVLIEHGTIAPYSVAKADLSVFWLSQDLQGQGIVIEGKDYNAARISTYAIEYAIAQYETISDAIGFTFQEEGHTYYQLTFPSADKTWVFDMAERLWHERTWIDSDGIEHRHRANCAAFAYGKNLVGDWETGALYQQDLNTYTDFGGPIVYRRGFPHLVNDGKRVSYSLFIADMAVGNAPGLLTDQSPKVYLRWSDTRGASWGNPVEMELGSTGQYLIQPMKRRLGLGRDRVFEMFWSAPYRTALNGGWIEAVTAGT